MGNVQSRKKDKGVKNTSQDQCAIELDDYVIVNSSESENVTQQSVIEFDPAKSCAICVGIDKQQHHKFLGNSLGDVAANGATLIGESFVKNMGMQKDRVQVYTSANMPQLCTKEAIKILIINYARNVEEEGMFTFYFSGHVVVYKSLNDKNEWVHALVSADFSGDVTTGITADDFVDWIQQANCKARHILIILDCCYAGGIGKKITTTVHTRAQVHVMCACAAKEITLPMNILSNSIFCYFLLYVLEKNQPKGRFALDKDMDEIVELCQLFSSLLMYYSSERGGLLKPGLIQPVMYSNGSDKTDNCDNEIDGSHKLNMLFGLYDKEARKPSMHEFAEQWLRSRVVQESLRTLLSIEPVPKLLLNGIMCALFYSISCIHLVYDRTHIAERNFFITVAISIMSAIGYSYPDVSISEEQLKLGLMYHYLPINSVGIPTNSIEKLFIELHVQNSGAGASTVDQNTVSYNSYKTMHT